MSNSVFPFNHQCFDANSRETTLLHSRRIQKKRFLREIYQEYYGFFEKEGLNLPDGVKLELGSGGGFIKQVLPEVLTSDVITLPSVDLILSALELPFASQSLSAILMVDVFHHLPRPDAFLREAERCLKPRGKIIMIEPANTFWSRFIFRHFHHEPFLPDRERWDLEDLPDKGRLTQANGALPWIVFKRDRATFERLFPGLALEVAECFCPFRYLLSGGVSFPSLVPGFTYPLVKWIENVLTPLFPLLGMFMKIVIVRK